MTWADQSAFMVKEPKAPLGSVNHFSFTRPAVKEADWGDTGELFKPLNSSPRHGHAMEANRKNCPHASRKAHSHLHNHNWKPARNLLESDDRADRGDCFIFECCGGNITEKGTTGCLKVIRRIVVELVSLCFRVAVIAIFKIMQVISAKNARANQCWLFFFWRLR